MVLTTLRSLLSHWNRNRLQLFAVLSGLALATALWSAVQAINSEARASYDRATQDLVSANVVVFEAAEGTIPVQTYIALRRLGIQVAPLMEGSIRIGNQAFKITGIDFLNPPDIPLLSPPSETRSKNRTELWEHGLSALGPEGRFFVNPADTPFLAQHATPPQVASEAVPTGAILTDLSTAAQLLDNSKSLSRLVLTARSLLAPTFSPSEYGLRRTPPQADGAETTRLTNSFHLNLTAFGLLAFAVGLFIVQGSFALSVEQRRNSLRTLRCLGVPFRSLAAALMIEVLLFACSAGILGLILGYFLAGTLLPGVSATLSGLYGAEVSGQLSLRPSWVLSGLGMSIIGALFASAQVFWTLWSMPILQATAFQARGQAMARDQKTLAVVGLFFLAIGYSVLWAFDGVISGFVFLAGLMLGAALVLPLGLGRIMAACARFARKPVFEWLWADSRAQLPGLSLAMMALLLALATNIGVGTMVSSFRLTFTGWLDQRLAADLYLSAAPDRDLEQVTQWQRQSFPDTRTIPIARTEGAIMGLPLRIYGVVDDPIYRNHWPILRGTPDGWDRLHQGQALMINEQLAYRFDLVPGDLLQLDGLPEFTVAGIYSDYGNPKAQVLMSRKRLYELNINAEDTSFGFIVPSQNVARFTSEIKSRFSLQSDAKVDQRAIKSEALEIFEGTFVITRALNVLTLGVAGFAMFTSLLILWSQRLPQLAPLWAMGLSRRRLAALDVLRSLTLAAVTAVFAIPLGLALAWALLNVVNVEAFGWRLPMYHFPLDWLRLFIWSVFAAFIAALWPAWKLMRISPSDLLKVFANER